MLYACRPYRSFLSTIPHKANEPADDASICPSHRCRNLPSCNTRSQHAMHKPRSIRKSSNLIPTSCRQSLRVIAELCCNAKSPDNTMYTTAIMQECSEQNSYCDIASSCFASCLKQCIEPIDAKIRFRCNSPESLDRDKGKM